MGLSKEDILVRVKGDIDKVSGVLSLSREATTILLIRYNWNINTLSDEWLADEEKVRKDSDLPENPMMIIDQSSIVASNCGICGDNNTFAMAATRDCGHLFCQTCWENHISKSIIINEGQGDCSMILRCPLQQLRFCRGMVDQSRIESLMSDEVKDIYEHYLAATYISGFRKGNSVIKWCPAPGCSRAVECFPGRRRIYHVACRCSYGNRFCFKCLEDEEAHGPFDCETIYDVTCDCSYKFCFKCLEEAHSPVDCETLIKWRNTFKFQIENQTWACPDCNRPLKEKNLFGLEPYRDDDDDDDEFCDWDACNFSDIEPKDDNERQKALKSLEKFEICRYTFAVHEELRQKALVELQRLKARDLRILSGIYHQSEDDLIFVVDAWVQIAECRRILKWAHVYCYFVSEDKPNELLEYSLEQAEALAKRLLHLAEISLVKWQIVTVTTPEYRKFLARPPPPDFQQLRQELSDLTLVTQNYFDNLVGAVQNDLFK